MDIHKPKPWHGWREFAKELGTIIMGILIALGLEQIVQALHERHLAAEARANIRQEVADNLGKMRLRLDAEPCHVRRLHEVKDLLDQSARGQPLARPISIGEPDVWEMSTSRLEVASQSGRASLLTPDEQAALARIYSHMRIFTENGVREQSAWATLRALEDGPPVDPSLRASLVVALQEARYDRFRTALAINQALREGAAIGIKPNVAAFRGRAHWQDCYPLHTSLEEVRRRDQALPVEDHGLGGPSE